MLDAGFVDRQTPAYKAFVTGSQKQRDLHHFKAFRDAHLLRTVDGRDFFFVCTAPPAPDSGESNLVELTPLGRYYRDLVVNGQIVLNPEGDRT